METWTADVVGGTAADGGAVDALMNGDLKRKSWTFWIMASLKLLSWRDLLVGESQRHFEIAVAVETSMVVSSSDVHFSISSRAVSQPMGP